MSELTDEEALAEFLAVDQAHEDAENFDAKNARTHSQNCPARFDGACQCGAEGDEEAEYYAELNRGYFGDRI